MFDYVCWGKVYRFEEGEGENMWVFDCPFLEGGEMREKTRLLTCDAMNSKVYVSFGGLLLYLEGPYKKLTPLRIDYVYLLIKKWA
jgi:DNA-directed RNA polymerase I, II, and III subunit RPABC3